jgi:retron-type reverse transcriptase
MKETLIDIFDSIKHRNTMGVDGITVQKYEAILEQELEIIERKVNNGTYNFSFYKEKIIAKSPTATRTISIPTIRDKIVLKYINRELKDHFKSELGYITPGIDIVKKIIDFKDQFECYVKIDIQNFFPSIDHELLMQMISPKIKDTPLGALIQKAIAQTTVSMKMPKEDRKAYDNEQGVPQGLSISGTLAAMYIFDIVHKYHSAKGIEMYIFVDDLLILCNDKDVESLQLSLENDFNAKKLSIHRFDASSDKSKVGKTSERFEYLGYVFDGQDRTVRDKSVQKLYKNLSKEFARYRYGEYTIHEFYTILNIRIAGCTIATKKYGWIAYYSYINDLTLLKQLDRFVSQNCEKLDIKYEGKIKKFSRAFYEIKKENSNYIPSIDNLPKDIQFDILEEISDDIQLYLSAVIW